MGLRAIKTVFAHHQNKRNNTP